MSHLKKDAIHFLPLGGCGEIGMNLNLYGCSGKWLMVDLGVMFHDQVPGVHVLMPDLRGFSSYKKSLIGLILTHAHEDHIGAIAYLWPFLRCPIYATPFTAQLVRKKFKDWGVNNPTVHEVPLGGSLNLDPFQVSFISVTHSIPEPNALEIKTRFGTIVHTGDWKIDDTPLIGLKTDEQALQKIGDKGVLALVCDSTNVFEEGVSGSEKEVQDNLMELVGQFPDVRVVISCFASNVARLLTCAEIAKKYDRKILLAGRSLKRMDQVARKCGYLEGYPPFLTEDAAMGLPRKESLWVCTGSQGEARATLSRIASGSLPKLRLQEGDVVIFSSRVIPGNEREIFALQNKLAKQGVRIVTHKIADCIHVSGHPSRQDLVKMYQWIRPQIVVPVHGEDMHLIEQAAFAKAQGVPQVIIPSNGEIYCLSDPEVPCVGKISAGRIGLDGRKLIPAKGSVSRDRERLMLGGVVNIALALNGTGDIQDMTMSLFGVAEAEEREDLFKGLEYNLIKTFKDLSQDEKLQESRVMEALRQVTKTFFINERGKNPVIGVQILRVS